MSDFFSSSSQAEDPENLNLIRNKLFLTRAEAAFFLRISISSLDRLVHSQTPPFEIKRIGRRVLLPSSSLLEFATRRATL